MASAENRLLPAEVRDRISFGERELFDWVWAELTARLPGISCSCTKRYIGFYPNERSRKIFAYFDAQQAGTKLGVFQSVVNRIQPQTIKFGNFPDWNPSGILVGLRLTDRNPEIIDVLESAYKARVYSVNSIKSFAERAAVRAREKLEAVSRKDIESFELEEERFEGTRVSRLSNFYERNTKLRTRAIEIHGKTCMVRACSFNFEQVYGPRGADFIEVHHRKPLSQQDQKSLEATNVAEDMVVVCSNCHRMIHRKQDQILDCEQVSKLIEEQRQAKS